MFTAASRLHLSAHVRVRAFLTWMRVYLCSDAQHKPVCVRFGSASCPDWVTFNTLHSVRAVLLLRMAATSNRIALCREEVSGAELNDLRGISNSERVDEALYQDFETALQRKVRASCLYWFGHWKQT